MLIDATWLLGYAYYVSDQAERAVEVLERALVAVRETEPELPLRLEAQITIKSMLNERTAAAGARRA